MSFQAGSSADQIMYTTAVMEKTECSTPNVQFILAGNNLNSTHKLCVFKWGKIYFSLLPELAYAPFLRWASD